MNSSATRHHCVARRRSSTRLHAASMLQLDQTTTSSRPPKPPRVVAIASSRSAIPSLHLAAGHEEQTQVGESHRVQPVVGGLGREPEGLLEPGTSRGGVGAQVGADQYQPAPNHRVRGVLGGPCSAGQPAAGGRLVLEVREVPDAQVEGRDGRLVVTARLAQQSEGTLPVADRGAHVAQPPAHPAQSVDRVRGLVHGSRRGEGCPCLLPPSGLGGSTRGCEALDGCHSSMIATRTRPWIGQLTDVPSARPGRC